MTTINLADMYRAYKQQDEVTVVPAGPYTLEVIRATTRNGAKGPIINLVYRVAEGPFAGKTVMAGGMTLSDASRSIFFRQLKGFGIDEAFIQRVSGGSDPIGDIAKALVGRVVKAQLVVEPWQGEDRNKLAIGGISLVRAAADPVAAAAGVPITPAPAQSQAVPAPMPVAAPVVAPAPEPPAPADPVPAPVATAAAAPPPPPPPPAAGGPRSF